VNSEVVTRNRDARRWGRGPGRGSRDPSPAAAYMRIVSKCYSATNAAALVVAATPDPAPDPTAG